MTLRRATASGEAKPRLLAAVAIVIASALMASSCGGGSHGEQVPGGPCGTYLVPAGIHKIEHVIVIMQENRSFDTYFGTFPGVDGIPMQDGKP